MRLTSLLLLAVLILGVLPAAVAQTAPQPPVNVTVIDFPGDTGTALQLNFGKSPDDGAGANNVTSYRVYKKLGTGALEYEKQVTATGVATYSTKIDGLVPRTQYGIAVYAAAGTVLSTKVLVYGTPVDNTTPRPVASAAVADVPNDDGNQLLLTFVKSPDDGTALNNVTSYRIYRKVGDAPQEYAGSVTASGAGTYQYTVKSLVAGTRYAIGIYAAAGTALSSKVTVYGTPVDNTAPPPPSGLAAADVPNDNGTQLRLTWNRSTGDTGTDPEATAYLIFRSTVAAAAGTQVASVPATRHASYSYTDTGLTPGTTYYYRLRTTGASGTSGLSSQASATPTDDVGPRPPGTLTITDPAADSGNTLQLSFLRSPDDGAGANDVKRYIIYKKPAGGSYAELASIAATGATSYQYLATGLQPGTLYYFGVRADDGTRLSTMVTGSATPRDTVAPAPPRDVALVNPTTDTGETMRLTWTRSLDDSPNGDVTHYKLLLREGTTVTVVGRIAATDAETYAYLFRGLQPGRVYGFGVCAWDGSNESTRVWVQGDSMPPGPARNLTLTDVPNDDGVALTLAFDRSVDDGTAANDVGYYRIFKRSGTADYVLAKTLTATDATSYTFVLNGLTPGTKYTVKVIAYDPFQESTPAVATGTPVDNTAPRPPRSLTVADWPDDDGTSLLVKFNASLDDTATDPEVTSYHVYRATTATDAGAKVGQVTATRAASYEFRNTGLTAGTLYYYWALAVGATGTSVPSNKASLRSTDDRPVRPPLNLTAQDRPYDLGGVIDLAWTRSGDDGTGLNHVAKYNIYRRMANVQTPPAKIGSVNANGSTRYTYADTAVPLELILYEYTVTAVSAGGVESVPTAAVRASSENNNVVVFQPPTNLTATDAPSDAGGRILLTWYRSPSENDIGPPPPPPVVFSTGSDVTTKGGYGGEYEFYRRTATGTYGERPTFTVDAAGTNNPMQYTDANGLTNGTRYYYKVRYRRYNQISNFTAEASAVPAANSGSSAADAPSAAAPATGADADDLSVTLVNAPTSCTAGKDLTLNVSVAAAGAASVYLEYTVNGGSPLKTGAVAGTGSFEAALAIKTLYLTPGTVLRVRAVVKAGSETAASTVATVVVGG